MKESIEKSKNTSGSALLRGQVALITGASRGIGAATALLLALPQADYLTGNYLAVGGGNYLP